MITNTKIDFLKKMVMKNYKNDLTVASMHFIMYTYSTRLQFAGELHTKKINNIFLYSSLIVI